MTGIKIRTATGTFDAVTAGPSYGPKVLLLHGFLSRGSAWAGQLDALAAAGYQAVAPDQRGYSPGVRPHDVEDYWLDYAVDDVAAIANSLGWLQFDIAGHGWGAAVGWIAAARYARRIRSLTAISTPHLGAFADALRSDPEQMAKAERWPEAQILRAVPTFPADRPGALTAALNWYRANDFLGYDQPVAVPTLFIAGIRDAYVAASGVRATRNWVTGRYRLENLLGVGHDVLTEADGTTTALLLNHIATV